MKISTSEDLDTEVLAEDKISDQCGTDESLRQLDDHAVVKGRSSVIRTQSEGDLNLNYRLKGPIKKEIGKREKKHTACWLEHQSSQLEKKRSRLYSRLIRKINAVNGLLYCPRNIKVVRKQMLQVDDLFMMVIEVHKIQCFIIS